MTGPYALLNRATGTVECSLRGAAPVGFLNRCAGAGVPILRAEPQGEDTLLLTLRQRDLDRAGSLALRAGCELTPVGRQGGRRLFRRLLRRWLPALLLVLLFAGLAWSKLFVWEIQVTGNEAVSSARILNALAECGVTTGSFWPAYTCDTLRSELLLKVPELAWATVQIYGSRAEVVVRERVPKPAIYDARSPVDVVARREGFVTGLEALNGTAQVRPGAAVGAGEVLIAGIADSAFGGTRQLHALGNVEAETYHQLSAAVPVTAQQRSDSGRSHSRWALEIGTQRINFYKNSSICGDSCDKLTTEWQWGIRGLFQLPVALVRERWTEYTLSDCARDENLLCLELEQQLHARLLETLGETGEILEEHYSRSRSGGSIVVCLRARCRENIAVEQPRTQEEQK